MPCAGRVWRLVVVVATVIADAYAAVGLASTAAASAVACVLLAVLVGAAVVVSPPLLLLFLIWLPLLPPPLHIGLAGELSDGWLAGVFVKYQVGGSGAGLAGLCHSIKQGLDATPRYRVLHALLDGRLIQHAPGCAESRLPRVSSLRYRSKHNIPRFTPHLSFPRPPPPPLPLPRPPPPPTPPLRAQDVATRLFLKRLKRELNIPVMGLVDSDPYGLKILSVYMSGEGDKPYTATFLLLQFS